MGEPEAISGNDVEKKTNEKSKTVLAKRQRVETKQSKQHAKNGGENQYKVKERQHPRRKKNKKKV